MSTSATSPTANSSISALTSTATKKTATKSLGMNDFFKLMAAQLQYQDPMQPTDNSQSMAQMAQFSLLESVQSMSQSLNFTVAASTMGKSVIYSTTDSAGNTVQKTGIISAVDLTSTSPQCNVNDEWIPLSSVSVVYAPQEQSTTTGV
jgi:flagellar basal-body rod modification protein FlgD